jgi:hypothetical protein
MEQIKNLEIEEKTTTDKNAAGALNNEALDLMLAAGHRRSHQSSDRQFISGAVRGLTGREFSCDMVVGYAPASWGCGPEKSFPDKPRSRAYHRETIEDMSRHY